MIVWDGLLLGYLPRGEKVLLTFLDQTGTERQDAERALAEALARLVDGARRRALVLGGIDGRPARQSQFGPALIAAGFTAVGDGFVLRRGSISGREWSPPRAALDVPRLAERFAELLAAERPARRRDGELQRPGPLSRSSRERAGTRRASASLPPTSTQLQIPIPEAHRQDPERGAPAAPPLALAGAPPVPPGAPSETPRHAPTLTRKIVDQTNVWAIATPSPVRRKSTLPQ